jgi:hypothetical protein
MHFIIKKLKKYNNPGYSMKFVYFYWIGLHICILKQTRVRYSSFYRENSILTDN